MEQAFASSLGLSGGEVDPSPGTTSIFTCHQRHSEAIRPRWGGNAEGRSQGAIRAILFASATVTSRIG